MLDTFWTDLVLLNIKKILIEGKLILFVDLKVAFYVDQGTIYDELCLLLHTKKHTI